MEQLEAKFYHDARAQRERLREQLASHPLYRALMAVEQVIQTYEAAFSPSEAMPVTTSEPKGGVLTGRGAKSGPIIKGAAEYLREKNKRAQSSEIAKTLLANGIPITGKNATAVVSSYLSHSPLFDNVQGQGYGLVEWQKPADQGLANTAFENPDQTHGFGERQSAGVTRETAAPVNGTAA